MQAEHPATAADTHADGSRIYIWLEGDPDAHSPDTSIEDIPGVNDIDQLAAAIMRGDLGRFLPVDLRYATHPNPINRRAIKSIDTARLLRDRSIRHRRRYEVFPDPDNVPTLQRDADHDAASPDEREPLAPLRPDSDSDSGSDTRGKRGHRGQRSDRTRGKGRDAGGNT